MVASLFCVMYKRPLKLLQGVLHDEQMVLERLHSGFASCTKGHEVTSFAWKFCTMTVLHVYKKALKLVQGTFARVQKGIERCKKGLVQ